MLRGIKIKLYPNPEQEIYINKLLGAYRFTYNKCLAYKIEEYNKNKHNISFSELGEYLKNLKKEFKWMKESHSKVLQQSIINLLDAYKSFFKNNRGFPKFKSKKTFKQSCRFPKDAISRIEGNRINIIKSLKNIHFKCSIRDEKYLNKNQGKIRSGTLSKSKSGNIYFSILIDSDVNFSKLDNLDKVIGIDLGIKDFIVSSNGDKFENIKIKRNNKKKIAKLHRELSRKKMGSQNREKSRIKLSKFYDRLNNQKEYYLHSVANKLLNENQVIVMEDLYIKGMLKNKKLSSSIQELSLFQFKEILKYKSKWQGKDIIEIDRFYPSSKLCNKCGYKKDNLTLKDRKWKCPSCHQVHNRDLNAAKNILNEGKRILKIEDLSEFKLI